MSERHRLPSLGMVRVPDQPPTVDGARAALGGRAATLEGAGAVVRMPSGRLAVVVFVAPHEQDVWIGEGRFARATESLEPAPATPELEAVAADARRFARLSEGDPVRYLDRSGAPHEGTLIEKCRYGALVLAPDERVLAVSFRRVFPRDSLP